MEGEFPLYLNILGALRLGLLQNVCYRVKWVWKKDVKYKTTIKSKTGYLYMSNMNKALKIDA